MEGPGDMGGDSMCENSMGALADMGGAFALYPTSRVIERGKKIFLRSERGIY